MRKGRIYIVPTRFGLLFIIGACVMLLVGATYQNNLVNLLAFFMLSLIFVAMVQTHNNLKDVNVETLEADSGFAGKEFVVTTILRNPSAEPRFNLQARLRHPKPETVYENVQPLLAKSSLKLRSAYRSEGRGRYHLTEVKISTVFPLGLFYSWVWYDVSTDYFIYPEPKGALPLPTRGIGDQDATSRQIALGGDDFHGHRRYEAGDSHRHIDWKARARGRPLLIKEFNEGATQSVLFDWYSLEGFDTESKLSQLTAWINEANVKRLTYALRMPAMTLGPAHGSQHATRCLEQLAMFQPESERKAKSSPVQRTR